jgi:peptidoglycan/xylan/chitin deacetylase (PgdA/CDA1 family)
MTHERGEMPFAERTCTVAMYHYIRDTAHTPFPRLHALGLDTFEAQLDFLGCARRIIAYGDFESGLEGGSLPAKASLLTFDDGVRDHYDVVSRLVARGVQGVFFVSGDTVAAMPRVLNVHKVHFLVAACGAEALLERLTKTLLPQHAPLVAGDSSSLEAAPPELYRYDGRAARSVKRLLNYALPLDFATGLLTDLFEEQFGSETTFARDLYLSPAMIVEMSRAGMTFGFHTETHPVLSRLSAAHQRLELERGPGLIRELTGQQRVPFCIPHGHRSSYNSDTVAMLAELGYSLAFTAVRAVTDYAPASRFEIPRLDTKDMPPFTDVAGLLPVTAST